MRHAKSDYPAGVADHERPLAPRGIREAGLAGDWLRANVPTIDGVLCSTATRAASVSSRMRPSAKAPGSMNPITISLSVTVACEPPECRALLIALQRFQVNSTTRGDSETVQKRTAVQVEAAGCG